MEKAKKITQYGFIALLLYMPFHIFISQWISTYTGGLNAWKVAKDVFTMALIWFVFGFVIYTGKYKKTPYLYFVAAAFAYLGLHMVLYIVMGSTDRGIAALGTVYNNRIIWYLIIGMSVALLTPLRISKQLLAKAVLGTSTIVCVVGLLQIVLPNDVMTHFGYSKERGVKSSFAIDDKPDLPRAFSTLRDPNSLGAFLLVPITLIWALMFRKEHETKRMLLGGLLLLHGLVLLLTFSRAAWIGVSISVLVASWLQYKSWLWSHWRSILSFVVLSFVILGAASYALRDQYFVQNVIFHSDENTQAELDSNNLHFTLAEQGFEEFTQNPLGDGPGTAGIVSIQSGAGGLLTENYYIQILHEVGIFGLLLFMGVLGYILHILKQNKDTLSVALFSTGLAYMAMSLVMHLWTNESVAAQWWLLSGFSIALVFLEGVRDTTKRRIRKPKSA